jgi:hypothetical protein
MFHHVLAKNSIEQGVVKGKRPSEVEEILNVVVRESIYVDPVRIMQAAWA